jgi:hypothetical protein
VLKDRRVVLEKARLDWCPYPWTASSGEQHLTREDGMSSDAPIVSQPGESEIVRIPLGRDIVIKVNGRETGKAYSILEFTALVGGEWTIPHVHHLAVRSPPRRIETVKRGISALSSISQAAEVVNPPTLECEEFQ